MPNSPTSSFIPKQGPTKRSRQVVSRQVHLFTVMSYVLFFGALAGSALVFLYNKHIENKLESEIIALNDSIGSFSDTKMEEVKAFNSRLQQTSDRLKYSVSAVTVMESLEDATAQAVSIKKLRLKRMDDEKFILTAEVSTDSFDSSLFQRGVFERSPIVESVLVEDLSLTEADETESVFSGPTISFKAELQIPLVEVPYTPVIDIVQPEVTTLLPTTTTSSSSIINESNDISL